MAATTCQISIVLPCFNARGHLSASVQSLLSTLKSQPLLWEILVVDDGSTDGSADILNSFSEDRLKLITSDKNRGKYAAVKLGMSKANGEVVIFTDSDLPYGALALLEIYELIKSGRYQFVTGDRTNPRSSSRQSTPFIRKLASKLFSRISSFFFGSKVRDPQCGLKGFSGDLSKKLIPLVKDNRFGGDLELLFLANKYNIDVGTIPVHLISVGESSVNVIRDGLSILLRSFLTIYFWSIKKYPVSLN